MQTVQELLSQIQWDRRLVSIPDSIQTPVDHVVVRDPTLTDRNHALLERQLAYQRLVNGGVPTEDEVLQIARDAGRWTEKDESFLSEVDDHVSFLRSEKSRQKFATRKRKLEDQIEAALVKAEEARQRREDFCLHSAEYASTAESVYCLMRRIVIDDEGDLRWSSDKAFQEDRRLYPQFVTFVANEVVGEGILPTVDIRRVARDPEWRLFWVLGKENLPSLFNRSIPDLNVNQKALVYWSKIYDIAFDAYEDRPSMDVLEDDEQFDDWLHHHLSKRSENDAAKPNKASLTKVGHHQEQALTLDGYFVDTCTCGVGGGRPKGLGERPKHAEDCPWGSFVKYSPQEKRRIIDEIYGRNSDGVRQIVGKEQDAIDRVGEIEEQHLRGRGTRTTLGMASKSSPRMRNGR